MNKPEVSPCRSRSRSRGLCIKIFTGFGIVKICIHMKLGPVTGRLNGASLGNVHDFQQTHLTILKPGNLFLIDVGCPVNAISSPVARGQQLVIATTTKLIFTIPIAEIQVEDCLLYY